MKQTESRQSHLQCATADCERDACSSVPIIPNVATVGGFKMHGFPELPIRLSCSPREYKRLTCVCVCVCVSEFSHITLNMNGACRLRLLQQVALLDIEDEEDDLLFANYYFNIRALRPSRNRRYWVKPWISRREQLGQYDTLMTERRAEDPEAFINYMRLPMDLYDEVLARITPCITKQDTWWRQALDPGLKFACTMRHLASSDSYISIEWDFRILSNTMSIFVPVVCQAIIDEYAAEVITCPTTSDELKEIANAFLQ